MPPPPPLVIGILLIVAMTFIVVSLWVSTLQLLIIAGSFVLLLAVLYGAIVHGSGQQDGDKVRFDISLWGRRTSGRTDQNDDGAANS